MHFHLPKPMHGWREFAGEVGIIVVGVLIALGAEQVVEAVHLRQQTNEARAQLRQELQDNYVQADERKLIQRCLDGQVDALEQKVLQSQTVLDPVAMQRDQFFTFVYRAPSRPWPAHVFENVRAEQVYGQLSEQERYLLGQTYTQLRDLQLMNDQEDNAVGMLMVMAKPLPLDAGVKAHLLEILENERRRSDLMALISSQVMDSAAKLGASPPKQRIVESRRDSGTLIWCKSHGFPA